jgi:hypothetical protein
MKKSIKNNNMNLREQILKDVAEKQIFGHQPFASSSITPLNCKLENHQGVHPNEIKLWFFSGCIQNRSQNMDGWHQIFEVYVDLTRELNDRFKVQMYDLWQDETYLETLNTSESDSQYYFAHSQKTPMSVIRFSNDNRIIYYFISESLLFQKWLMSFVESENWMLYIGAIGNGFENTMKMQDLGIMRLVFGQKNIPFAVIDDFHIIRMSSEEYLNVYDESSIEDSRNNRNIRYYGHKERHDSISALHLLTNLGF